MLVSEENKRDVGIHECNKLDHFMHHVTLYYLVAFYFVQSRTPQDPWSILWFLRSVEA